MNEKQQLSDPLVISDKYIVHFIYIYKLPLSNKIDHILENFYYGMELLDDPG